MILTIQLQVYQAEFWFYCYTSADIYCVILVSIHLSSTFLPWSCFSSSYRLVLKYQCANVLGCQHLIESQLFLSDIVNIFTRRHDKCTLFMATKESACEKWNSLIELVTCDSSLENIYNFNAKHPSQASPVLWEYMKLLMMLPFVNIW